MRKAYLLLLLAPSVLVWACGGSGDDSLAGDGGTNDATTGDGGTNDSATGQDTGSDVATNDGGTNDSGSTDSGNDAKLSLDCLSPADCDGGNVCCGDIALSGTVQNCTFSSVTTDCKSANSCPTSVLASISCTGTDQVRLCTQNADCTEQQYNKCCTVKQGDAGGVSICLNTQLAGQVGGTCQ
jgi:hypothetical protein